MKNKLLQKSGIVMTEALMAVALMASAVIITGGIIETTVSTTKQTRDYAVAQNLASEAIEGVKNIINSNKILYSGLESNSRCWLTFNTDPCNEGTNTPIDTNNYITKLENGRWILVDMNKSELDLNTTADSNNSFLLFQTNKQDEDTTGYSVFSHDKEKTSEPSAYYRSIKFLKIADDYAIISVLIQWQDRSVIRSFSNTYTIQR